MIFSSSYTTLVTILPGAQVKYLFLLFYLSSYFVLPFTRNYAFLGKLENLNLDIQMFEDSLWTHLRCQCVWCPQIVQIRTGSRGNDQINFLNLFDLTSQMIENSVKSRNHSTWHSFALTARRGLKVQISACRGPCYT